MSTKGRKDCNHSVVSFGRIDDGKVSQLSVDGWQYLWPVKSKARTQGQPQGPARLHNTPVDASAAGLYRAPGDLTRQHP